MGGDPGLISPGCFSYAATLTAGPAHLLYCCFFASSQDRLSHDHLCLKASLKPQDPPRQLTWTPRITFLHATPTFGARLWFGFPPSLLSPGDSGPISRLPSPAPVVALLPALGPGLLLPSPVPMAGAVKEELPGKMPLAGLSPKNRTADPFPPSLLETHPFSHSCVKRSQMPILNV